MRVFLLGLASFAFAQPPVPTHVIVTGTYQPIPLQESDRAVQLLDLDHPAPLLANSPMDYLRLDPSVDLRQRAPNGLQADVSIRGSTFGQTLILLDGLRLNDVQSGHHNLDLPVPLEGLDRIEVLKGAGSTLYGSDAVGGVINFVTRAPTATEVRLRAALGNFGVNQERGVASLAQSRWSEQLTFSRDFSTGFRPDRDYRNLMLSSVSRLRTKWGATGLTLASTDRPFGADQFYGNYPSWERTRAWFAGLRQELGPQTEINFGYRRHTDLFVLDRDHPEGFTNRHASESYQAAVRRRQQFSANTRLHYGVEGLHEAVESTNLGRHARSRGAAYAALDVRALRRFSVSLGAREEWYGHGGHQFAPTVTGGAWLSSAVKLRATMSHAFRLPTYTDLYYHDPFNLGSPNLRPETAWSYDGGVEWHRGPGTRAEATVFYRRESDGIDYVRANADDIWRATNFQRLRFTGIETAWVHALPHSQQLALRYTGLHSSTESPGTLNSRYVFSYPRHNGVVEYRAAWKTNYVCRTRVGVVQRYAQNPYAVWDVYAARTEGWLRPFFQVSNLTAANYQEILGVIAPGRAFIGGVEWKLWQRH